jgi:hypothetical protein
VRWWNRKKNGILHSKERRNARDTKKIVQVPLHLLPKRRRKSRRRGTEGEEEE